MGIEMKVRDVFQRLINRAKTVVASDRPRKKLSFCNLNAALALTSFIMSVVNLFTGEYILMVSTLLFSLVCLLNILLLCYSKVRENAVYMSFSIEAMILLTFFIVSGIPNGFSVLWICLIPSFALLTLGVKMGSAFSLSALGLILFFFWLPFGRELLVYSYTNEFMLRFPFLYASIYLISLINECIRQETQRQFENIKEKYVYLYRHDALTGLYNRYGIKEHLDKAFGKNDGRISVLLLDIDDVPEINDRHGHECGDKVLSEVAKVPLRIMCDHCKCCRWGGEEFLLIMQCGHDAETVAENIREEIEKLNIFYNGNVIKVTVSIGICSINDTSEITAHEAIDRADKALYNSKDKGKNCVTVCEWAAVN